MRIANTIKNLALNYSTIQQRMAEGWTYQDIATHYGCSESTIRVHVTKMRKKGIKVQTNKAALKKPAYSIRYNHEGWCIKGTSSGGKHTAAGKWEIELSLAESETRAKGILATYCQENNGTEDGAYLQAVIRFKGAAA